MNTTHMILVDSSVESADVAKMMIRWMMSMVLNGHLDWMH